MVACRVSGALFWTVADLASSFLVFRKIFCNIDKDDDYCFNDECDEMILIMTMIMVICSTDATELWPAAGLMFNGATTQCNVLPSQKKLVRPLLRSFFTFFYPI